MSCKGTGPLLPCTLLQHIAPHPGSYLALGAAAAGVAAAVPLDLARLAALVPAGLAARGLCNQTWIRHSSIKFRSKRGRPQVPRNAEHVQHAVEAYSRTSAQAASPAGALRQAQQKLVGWPLRVEAPGGGRRDWQAAHASQAVHGAVWPGPKALAKQGCSQRNCDHASCRTQHSWQPLQLLQGQLIASAHLHSFRQALQNPVIVCVALQDRAAYSRRAAD